MLEGFIQDSKETQNLDSKNQNTKDKKSSSDSLTINENVRSTQPCESRLSRGAQKAETTHAEVRASAFSQATEERGSPPLRQKSGCFFSQRGSGEGDLRFFAQSVNENQRDVILKNINQQKLDSIESKNADVSLNAQHDDRKDSKKNIESNTKDSKLSPIHHPTFVDSKNQTPTFNTENPKKTKNLINKINTKDSKNKKNEWQNTHFFALNEFLLSRDDLGGMLELEAFIDGELFNHYRLDGLLVATPTGSSAYNISAGGSLVFPSCRNVLLTPVCPHALTQRPIILNDEFDMRFKFCTSGILIADGQQSIPISKGKIVHIKVAKYGAMLVEFNTNSYFMRLRDKFGWGQSE
ncbi:hypothetical protein DCO58_09425 [Helicobacter saguini]|nr:hypothetical protein [Helicobacter saguini]TLD94821.1 NAD(+)/NADH kinase [Helicobacter saguini]